MSRLIPPPLAGADLPAHLAPALLHHAALTNAAVTAEEAAQQQTEAEGGAANAQQASRATGSAISFTSTVDDEDGNVDLNVEVCHFLSCTGLVSTALLSDEELLTRLGEQRVQIVSWERSLCLAHPALRALLDDFDERLLRYVRHHKWELGSDYRQTEGQELKQMEKGEHKERDAGGS